MGQPLSQFVGEVGERIKTAERVSLFLDFDGTLSWLAPSPETAWLSEQTRETLDRISKMHHVVTTIISGRAVEDLYARVRLDGLIYAGNHGLEIFGRHLRFVEPSAAARRELLSRLSLSLAERLQPISGALVEYKGYTASIHYRQASETDVPEIEDAVRRAVALVSARFRVNAGKKVFEIVPRTDWHKGAAVHWINRHLGNGAVLPIYLGDDATDEDAFCVLPDAITVKVGPSEVTCARYQLPDPAAVHEFLEWLAGAK